VKALIFDGGVRVSDIPLPPIYKGHVLVEVIAGVSNGIENAIYNGYVWVNPGTVLGCEGVGKVKYIGVNVKQDLIGKKVVPKYTDTSRIPGIHINGFLSEYVSLPYDSLEVIRRDVNDKIASVLRSVSIAIEVSNKASNGRILIMGTGFTAKLTAILSSDKALEVYIVADKIISDLKEYATTLKPHSKLLYDKKWDFIFISSLNPLYQLILQKGVDVDELIIHPLIAAVGETIKPGKYKVEVVKGVEASKSLDVALKYSWFIEKNVSLTTSLELTVPSIKPKTIWLRSL